MDIRSALKGQYHAGLAMLREAIEKCPEDLWLRAEAEVPFWRVAYHTLFFTDFYLRADEHSFVPWEKHDWAVHDFSEKVERAYTKEEVLAYWERVDRMVDSAVDATDLDRQECGFPWYRMPKLDHQLVNIRHVQHHAAALISRLRRATGVDVEWVGKA
jgi:hypothetical protein